MKSPIGGWRGGKSKLCKKIVQRIPEHTCYAEVFAGAAWVLFAKDESTSKVEVINDIHKELVNLYRVAQHHLEEFCRHFKFVLTSREGFAQYKDSPPETLTDIQRATRYYYLLKCSFGGRGQNFGTAATGPVRLNLTRLEEELSMAHQRLARVNVECLPYQELIRRYDRPKTFFYLDPPYWGCEKDYGPVFSREDFEVLAKLLGGIKGKFLLSLNDVPQVNEMFHEFKIEPVTTTYSCSRDKCIQAKELFISNYEAPGRSEKRASAA